ncbi:MAG: nucleotidyl transferase AbiEii/AbiGii toxin family protein, partial [Betaproteobacteria bacterium]|nr:nucleotidyl transferase AbiEii/AbiGii toxin family protein [Betaproteobacteria bacterium]
KIILTQMQERHRKFLLGIAQGNPDWDLVDIKNVHDLPALKWKLIKVGNMDAQKRQEQIDALRSILENA